jgi:glucokinase
MYIAIDIGGTNIRVASFKNIEDSKYIELKEILTVNNFEEDIKKISDLISELSDSTLTSIGIGFPGQIDQNNIIFEASNLTNWLNKDPYTEFKKHLSTPIFIRNDSETAAIGEASIGKYKNENLFFVILGTGLGGTNVQFKQDKVIVSNTEVGHHVLNIDGEVFDFRNRGEAELYTSGSGIKSSFQKDAESLTEAEWDEVAKRLAQIIVNIQCFTLTNKIIFGGGVILKQKHLLEKAKKHIENMNFVFEKPILDFATFGEEAGIYGALAIQDPKLNLL